MDRFHRHHQLVGDVAFAEASKRASYITPSPRRPTTVAYLLANTVSATVLRR
ncbi:hypothetical protein ACIPUD_38785 [Bradyrhizobium sp. CAR08]